MSNVAGSGALKWTSLMACVMLALSACVPIERCEQGVDPLAPWPTPTAAPWQPRERWLPTPEPIAPQPRFGVGVPSSVLSPEVASWLGVSWYITWAADTWDPPSGIEFWPMLRVSQTGFYPGPARLIRLVAEHPGATWIVGNEPDIACWQDDVPPRQYAMVYHIIYTLIKNADPTARVAMAAVAQPSELRLRYLDQVLASYRQLTGRAMPVDVWTLHTYILNEQIDSWGAGIPRGFPDSSGEMISIDQHDNMGIFRQRILRFRQWMAANGYRDRELAITEFGILMPPDYGFGPERVRQFMWATFDYFRTATDPEAGLPSDDNHLVQRWAWFSVNFWQYPTSDLVDPATGQLTQVGHDFAEYVRAHAPEP